MNIRNLFISVAKEAIDAKVTFEDETWPFAFNTKLEKEEYSKNDYFPTIIIKNEDEFFRLLEIYVNKTLESGRRLPYFKTRSDQIRFIISYLFVNATTEEFNNPIELLNKHIAFLEDDTFKEYDVPITLPLDGDLENTSLSIRRNTQSIYLETPHAIKLKIEDDTSNNDYELGEISYGIYNNTCYVYSMMNRALKSDDPFYKKINRKLFKLNNNIFDSESDEFKEYKNNNREGDYYPENITDVSMPFVLSLSAFINLLKEYGITDIKVVTYLPLRYLSRTDEERNNNIQRNATDKLIRTFRRVAYQMDGVEVTSLPYELDEYLTLKLDKTKDLSSENEMLDDLSRSV